LLFASLLALAVVVMLSASLLGPVAVAIFSASLLGLVTAAIFPASQLDPAFATTVVQALEVLRWASGRAWLNLC
jgi:hypothetical protein